MTPLLDHIIWACADLEDGSRRFEALTGIRPRYGGVHAGGLTHNALVGLGNRCYLEILAPARPAGPEDDAWCRLARLALEPRILTYCLRSPRPLSELASAARAFGWKNATVASNGRTTPEGVRITLAMAGTGHRTVRSHLSILHRLARLAAPGRFSAAGPTGVGNSPAKLRGRTPGAGRTAPNAGGYRRDGGDLRGRGCAVSRATSDTAGNRFAVKHASPPPGEWLGYPKGALLIIGVEFWERFSFYGMLSILVLFLTGSPTRGGFGWPAAEALGLLGTYSGAMYAFPAFGGYLADRVLGRRRAVTLGASCMLVGQIMLASPVFLPALLGWWHSVPLLQALHELGVPLGRVLPSDAINAAIVQRGVALDALAGAAWLKQAYSLAAIGFFTALLCLVLGNALMKSTLVVLCGETMSAEDPRREGAYAYYYLGISVGAMLSGVAVGTIAQIFGWHVGFAVGAAGMGVALGSYVLLAPRWLGAVGTRPDTRPPIDESIGTSAMVAAGKAGTEARLRIGLLLILASLLCAFSVGWFQLFGSWLLFIDRDVHRAVGSFVIPVPWFASINAAVVIVLAPMVAAFWVRLGTRNKRIDIAQKYAFALAMVAIGHLLMYLAARGATPNAPASVWIPLASLSLLGIGEIVAWTATYGMVSRAAPAGFASVAMGAWYLMTLGLGGYLSGFTGNLLESIGFAGAFGAVTVIMGAACVMALSIRGPLLRLAARAGVSL